MTVQSLNRGERPEDDAADFRAGQAPALWQLDKPIDEAYERRIMSNIVHIARRALGMRLAKVLKGNSADASELNNKVEDAETLGLITPEQGDRLFWSDAVISGMSVTDGSPLHAVVEISAAIGETDVVRAAERAAILSAVMGESAKGVVVGDCISDPDRRRAERADVAVMIRRQ